MTVFNLFPDLATWYPNGLNSIIEASHSTKDEILSAACSFARTTFSYTSDELPDAEQKAICNAAINAYINGEIVANNSQQNGIIFEIMRRLKCESLGYIPKLFDEAEIAIEQNLPLEERKALFLVTAIGRASYTYWLTEIQNKATSDWGSYFSSDDYINHSNLISWIIAAMQSALFTYGKGSSQYGITNPPQFSGPNVVNALSASLVVSATKVILGYYPRLNLNNQNNFLQNPT